ncbi:MAG: translation initiation factor [Undibacterium sp.]|nr:translation initiation factor [Opitutaceae bacterium]
MSNFGKISTDGGQGLGQNPFGALSGAGLPATPAKTAAVPAVATEKGAGKAVAPTKNRGRLEVRRETGGRGGKTVTTVDGFVGIGLPEKEQLCKKMRGACGCGGTVKDGLIEIQGDQREAVARILAEAGFRAVMAGG